jgi:hypothetical protein
MSALYQPPAQQLTIVNAIVALTAYVGAKLHLFNNNIPVNPLPPIGSFIEPVFSGYSAKTVTWSAGFFDENGNAVSSAGESLFIQTGATGDVCYGAFLTDSAGTLLLGAALLDPPVPFPFVNQNDALALSLKLGLNLGTLIRDLGP